MSDQERNSAVMIKKPSSRQKRNFGIAIGVSLIFVILILCLSLKETFRQYNFTFTTGQLRNIKDKFVGLTKNFSEKTEEQRDGIVDAVQPVIEEAIEPVADAIEVKDKSTEAVADILVEKLK